MDHNYFLNFEMQPESTLLVLGALDGDFIREKKQEILKKNITVINVEPNLNSFKDLLNFSNSQMPRNALILNLAFSNKTGFAVFNNKQAPVLSCLNSIKEEKYGDCSGTFEFSKVMTISLDDFLSLWNVDYIICDIEGAELDVFLNSKKIREVSYYAIAAYHVVDGEETVHKLKNFFDTNNFITDVFIDSERQDGTILYCERKN